MPGARSPLRWTRWGAEDCCWGRSFYFWAVQQAEAGFVGVDGNAYPPRWQLREQTVSAAHQLL